MESIGYANIHAGGDPFWRAKLSLGRFGLDDYAPAYVYANPNDGWPGDMEGRVLLALVLLSQATGIEAPTLEEMMELLPLHLNENGYFGPIMPSGEFDENQFSGCGWYLRAICEYYNWRKDPAILELIRKTVEHLYLPARGHYKVYPSTPDERVFDGDDYGVLTGKVFHGWHTSSDIGCAFIALDGVTAAYEILRTPELAELITEMIAKFITIDLLEIQFQTHAALSCARGMLRFHETTGEPSYLADCERLFQLYMEQGSSENYENYNCFMRTRFSEPCGAIDSYIVAVRLWRNTRNKAYLDIAHYIQYNAIGFMQWSNGGFSCCLCSGTDGAEFVQPRYPREVTWCCTMRGGEGVSKEVEYLYFRNGDEITLPFYADSTAEISFRDGNATLRQTSFYPAEGFTVIDVAASDAPGVKSLRLFIPEWVDAKDVVCTVNGATVENNIRDGFLTIRTVLSAGTKIVLRFPITLRSVPTHGKNTMPGYRTLRHGALILGTDNRRDPLELPPDAQFKYLGNANYRLVAGDSGFVLSPIDDRAHLSMSALLETKRQILFKI